CRLRDTPIITFVNKLDRDIRDGIELLDEVENVLKIRCAPIYWPLGMGKEFKGIYNLYTDTVHVYEKEYADEIRVVKKLQGLDSAEVSAWLGPYAEDFRAEIELVRGASHAFDKQAYLEGKLTPVFFGTALGNFGVEEMLDDFVQWAPAPLPRATRTRVVDPVEPAFSGFVFKIQANMDPKHRDRIAFLRVCSGRFERGMKIKQVAGGKQIAVNNAITFMARDRNTTDEAYAGDIIGIPNHGTIRLGETFTEGENLRFTGIPSFAPELFQRAILRNPLKLKQLQKGLQQLAEEGATQLFRPIATNDLILGAVGSLQFDVVAHRLANEYGVDAIFEPVSVATARWLQGSDEQLRLLSDKYPQNIAHDGAEDLVYLAPNSVNLRLTEERFPDIRFMETREVR
ncbi:MAG: peptide chain release factor 3, partial [Sterolibacterium sp.]|nr:peptide chain release factor 3 [Sterolibacterium sp.]